MSLLSCELANAAFDRCSSSPSIRRSQCVEANQRFVKGSRVFALLALYYLHVTVFVRVCVRASMHTSPAVPDSKGACRCEPNPAHKCLHMSVVPQQRGSATSAMLGETFAARTWGEKKRKRERNLCSSAKRAIVHLRAPFFEMENNKSVRARACAPQPTLAFNIVI